MTDSSFLTAGRQASSLDVKSIRITPGLHARLKQYAKQESEARAADEARIGLHELCQGLLSSWADRYFRLAQKEKVPKDTLPAVPNVDQKTIKVSSELHTRLKLWAAHEETTVHAICEYHLQKSADQFFAVAGQLASSGNLHL